nr:MAG TPA: immunity protein [Caudoviricetes sp.]
MDGGDSMTINGNMLVADSGKVLKNGDNYATVIYLGVNDKVDNWSEVDEPDEITDAEALKIITGTGGDEE